MLKRSVTLFGELVLASIVGVIGGLVSATFIGSLNWSTSTRHNHDWLIWLMPLGGLVIGLAYHHLGKSGDKHIVAGNNLVLDELHEPGAGVPRRMAPMVYLGSVISHLVGASVGREGAAVQITASLTDAGSRFFNPTPHMRRLLLVSAIAAGFGAMFGVPVAGAIFAIEVQHRGKPKYDYVLFALTASIVGERIVRELDIKHLSTPKITKTEIDFALLWRVVVASVVFAAIAVVFIKGVHNIKDLMQRVIKWGPGRPFIGALLVLALTVIIDSKDYLGLSTRIAETALLGAIGLSAVAFLWKMIFTSISLGSGFVGGEVLPIFIIGALVGAQSGRLLNASIPLFAALGFIGVFSAAANTPIACFIIGIELFGAEALVPMAIVCGVSYALSGNASIYSAQRN